MDFYTQWCGPCKLIKPTLCDWAEEFSGKVNFRKFEASKENAEVGKKVRGIGVIEWWLWLSPQGDTAKFLNGNIPNPMFCRWR